MPKASASSPSLLLDVIGRKFIPWVEQGGMQRIVIARKSYRDVILPPEVRLSHKKLVSRPTGTHGPRPYGSASAPLVQWDGDDQEAKRFSILVCVMSGQADYQIGDYVLHCPEGTFIFIPPGVPHPQGVRSHLEGENRVSGHCDLMWFSPQGRRIQCWVCSSHGEEHIFSSRHGNIFLMSDQLFSVISFMHEEAIARPGHHEKMFGVALQLFMLTLHRELKEGHFLQLVVAPGDELAETTATDPIERALDYIKTHLSVALTIDTVAHSVHMSRAQFTRRFHQQTGQTFVEYVSARRVEQAQMLLRETDWAVAQISEFIGFRSASHFHRLFHSAVGASPREFRLKAHAENAPDRL